VVVRGGAPDEAPKVPHLPGQNGSTGKSDLKVSTVVLPADADPGLSLRALTADNDGYDFAVVAVPSPDLSPAAVAYAPAVGLAILVATANKTRFPEAQRTAELLRQSGAELVGSILVSDRVRQDGGHPVEKP
jgi:hypothetical protein